MRLAATRQILRPLIAVGVTLLAACAAASDGSVTPNTGIAGSWSTQNGAQTSIVVALAQSGSSLSGSGTINVPPLAPASGPSIPAYTGDNFTITTGSYNDPDVSFSSTLGANPDGSGGFYRGTLSFTGTLSAGKLSGTLTFTPPRTASQTFAPQTMAGVTLTKP